MYTMTYAAPIARWGRG